MNIDELTKDIEHQIQVTKNILQEDDLTRDERTYFLGILLGLQKGLGYINKKRPF